MNIRHERPETDLSFLVTAPLQFFPDESGIRLKITSWSLSGLLLPPEAGEVSGAGILKLPFQGVMMDLPITLGPVGEDGLHPFVDLTVRQREVLTCLYRGILSGRMSSAEEMIQSLDTPVEKVPMSETQSEREIATASIPARLLRALRTLFVYALVAALLFFGVGTKVWQRLDQIEPSDAHVIAPLIPHFVPESAVVKKLRVSEGEQVAAGQVLVEFSHAGLEREIDAVRARVSLLEDRTETITREVAAQRAVAVQARDALGRLAQQLTLAFEDARHPEVLKVTAAVTAYFDADAGPLPSGDPRVLLRALEQRALEAQEALRFAKRELGDLKEEGKALNIRAHRAGTVHDIQALRGMAMAGQALALRVEANETRTLVGFLSDRFADQVYIGMPAQVSLRQGAERSVHQGQVRDIRLVARGGNGASTSGTTNLNAAQAYGMQVEVAITGLTTAEAAALLRPDAPVRLRLSRQSAKRVQSSVLGLITPLWAHAETETKTEAETEGTALAEAPRQDSPNAPDSE